jgi:hypothetical protein
MEKPGCGAPASIMTRKVWNRLRIVRQSAIHIESTALDSQGGSDKKELL